MKKKICLLMLAGMMMLGVTGCKEDNSGRYALIVNNTTPENQICTDEVWEGLKLYAESKEVGCERYTAKGTERKDYAEIIETAVDNGAEVVICVGEEMEVPVYEAQGDFSRVNFILLNGEPHKRYSEKTNIKENTIALHFNETQLGYVMGYTAVMNGYRNIGCMGGEESETNSKITAGFIRGIEDAGKQLELADGEIQLQYTYVGEDKVSPVYMSKALDWYKGGCEVIFALDEGVRLSVVEAAKLQSGWVSGTDKDGLKESDRIITSAVFDYAGAVTNQIELIETDTFVGEQAVNCGVKEKGITLVTENSGFSDYTISQYNDMCLKFSEGTLILEETAEIPATTVTTVVKQ